MAKILLKCGDMQIEYDGPENFLKSELQSLVKAVSDLRPLATASQGSNPQFFGQAGGEASVSTIAQQLGVKNGPDLIMSAAFSLARNGSTSFSKKILRDKIKDAKTFYKASYANNFDNYVSRLVKKGRLNHLGGDAYSVPDSELAALSAQVRS